MLTFGDMVKYHKQNNDLDKKGYIEGYIYSLHFQDGNILVTGGTESIILKQNNKYTDHANSFTRHVCPLTILPRGLKNEV